MKHISAWILIFVMLLSLLVGCSEEEAHTTAAVVQTTAAPTDPPRETIQTYTPYLTIGQTGKARIAYTINLSSVKYITSVDQLPDNECFGQYDDAYFRDKALIIVTETVKSGSVNVEIESVRIDVDRATVTLLHDGSNGPGTGDMATWLLWAEVEQGLNYSWVVANPAVGSNVSNT